MIEWRDIIEIAKRMFDINQTEIAKLLNCDKSAITRLKKEGAQPTFANEQMFSCVFDPSSPNSPASKLNSNEYYLNLLKEIIEAGTDFIELRETLADCWDEKDYKIFVLRMLDRARNNRLSRSATLNTKSMTKPNNTKTQAEQLQALFLMAIHEYKVMDIINRKPAILNRLDSADLNNFLRDIDTILPAYNSCGGLLRASIESFSNALLIQVLSLDATLNNRFSFEDENASVNMEDTDTDLAETDEVKNRLELPEFSLELIESAEDQFRLLRTGISEWGNFRDDMNRLFERIRLWSDKEREGIQD